MAKKRYTPNSMHGSSLRLLEQMIEIVEDYEQRGFKLTVRQLFYQLVSRNILPNRVVV